MFRSYSPEGKLPDSTTILSVTELTSEIRFQLSNQFSRVFVCGEISGLSQPKSGHFYFSLKDSQSQIRAVIWQSEAERILRTQKFELRNGLSVICGGSVDVYPARGEYQLTIRSVQPYGEGALELAFRQLREKLELEGLFDARYKKPLPKFPRRIALITSPTGAAVKDFLHVLSPRWPDIEIIVLPVRVQGEGAAFQISYALQSIARFAEPPDVVVLTRGGGSLEDLWSFNEEPVCRAIFNCPIPVICGVGHETDVTLADLVADVRALTPSDAAMRVVPDQQEIRQRLNHVKRNLIQLLRARSQQATEAVDALANRPVLTRPLDRYRFLTVELDRISEQIERAREQTLLRFEDRVNGLAARLEGISPLSVLARGYSLTTDDEGGLITEPSAIKVGSLIRTKLSQGMLTSRVENVRAENVRFDNEQ